MRYRAILLVITGYIVVVSAVESVNLHWLDGSAPITTPAGTAFGLPWPQGVVNKTTSIAASTEINPVAVQTWPLAYWPDGSVKWTGHALGSDSGLSKGVTISLGQSSTPANPVSVAQSGSRVIIKTGSFTAILNTQGTTLIEEISLNGQTKVSGGSLVAHIQAGPEPEPGEAAATISVMTGEIEAATVEQSGPVRAVVKFTGKYSGAGHASFLPFTLRLYVSAGASAIRAVHFFAYDGDQNKDFIKGLGFSLTTPQNDALYDRHVRFGTASGGVLGEAVLGLSGLRRDATAAVLTPQFEGKLVPDPSTWPTTVSSGYKALPTWADWQADQLGSERFLIKKRTDKGKNVVWLPAGEGSRTSGTGYVGGAKAGGLGWSLREAWQRASTGVDVRGLHTDSAQVTIWAHSPRSAVLDMRHYDTVAHGLDLTYEDVGNPNPDPTGVGRSYDLTIQVFASTPSRDTLAALASVNIQSPQLVAKPEFYASRNLFGGRWNVPNYSKGGAAAIEKAKSDLLDFYIREVEERKWYGFWDYGDVMHTYDSTRHVWRYDVGGYAWDNGELGTDLWLWTSFLRTGRADVFKMASAMTRHLSEVDSHHIGTYAGLGSRHHVTHWGDGAKEARVASSTLRRPYYYLTTDELMGDLMDTTLLADQSIVTWEPLRKDTAAPALKTVGRLRIGPDWTSLAGNWFTHWERTLNATYLERIKTGMHDLGSFKYGLFSGYAAAVGYDPVTAHLTDVGGEGTSSYHLSMIFGGGEFLIELVDVIKDVPEFDAAWIDFCKYYNANNNMKIAKYGKTWNSGGFANYYAKLEAYAGQRLNDTSLKQAAWDILNINTVGVWPNATLISGPKVLEPVYEIKDLGTNDAGQFSLTQYAVLAIAPELAPDVPRNASL